MQRSLARQVFVVGWRKNFAYRVLRLTKRAADGGESARFLGMFLALGFSRFDGESTLRPTAANASRWVLINQ